MVEAESVGTDVAETGGIQGAAERGDDGAESEGDQLDPEGVDANRLGRQLVLAYPAHGATERDAQPRVGPLKPERHDQRWPCDAADPVGSAGDGRPVDGEQAEDDLEADAHHREGMAA